MENICIDVPPKLKPRYHHEYWSINRVTLLRILDLDWKQKCWRLRLGCTVHSTGHGSSELARNAL